MTDRMDFHLTPGGLEIRFPPGTPAALFVQGALQAEFGLGSKGPEDLREEVRRARAAKAACEMMGDVLGDLKKQGTKPDHRVKPAERERAFAAGLQAGLKGQHRVLGGGTDLGVPMAADVVEPAHPLNGPSYMRGWGLGCAILAAVEIAAGRPDPRRLWGTKPHRRAKEGARKVLQGACFSRPGWWQTLCGRDAANQGFGWTDDPKKVGCKACQGLVKKGEHEKRPVDQLLFRPTGKVVPKEGS